MYLSFQRPHLIQCIYISGTDFEYSFEHSLYWLLPDDSWEGSPIPSVIWRDCYRQGHPDPYGTFVQIRKRASFLEQPQPWAKAASSLGSSIAHFLSWTYICKAPPTNGSSIGQLETQASVRSRHAWSSCPGSGSTLRTGAQRGHDASSPSASLQAREVGGASTRSEGRYRSAMLATKA